MSSNTSKTKYNQMESTDDTVQSEGSNTDIEAGVDRKRERRCLNVQRLECKGRHLLVALIIAIGAAVPIGLVVMKIKSGSKSPSNSDILLKSRYFTLLYSHRKLEFPAQKY